MKRIISLICVVISMASCFNLTAFSNYRNNYDSSAAVVNYLPTKIVQTDDYGKSVTTNTYDKSGNIVKTVFKSENPDQNSYTQKNTYNSQGQLTKSVCSETNYYGDKSKYTVIKSFNKSGRLVKKTIKDDYATFVATYAYDKAGNTVKETEKQDNIEYSQTAVNTYNKDGTLKHRTRSYVDFYGKHNLTFDYKYDKSGRLIKINKKIDDGDGDKYDAVYNYSYDKKGNRSKEVYTCKHAAYTSVTTYTYNSKNQITKSATTTTLDGEKSSSVITYTYDKNGNLAKKVKSEKSTSGTVSKTTLNYTYKKFKVKTPKYAWGIHLSKTSFVYDGKAKKPNVFIDGEFYKGLTYTIKYLNNVKIGKAKVVVTIFQDDYYIKTKTIYFKITPAAPTGLSSKNVEKNSLLLIWKKEANAAKYEVYKYIAKSNTYVKVATVTAAKAEIKNLASKTKYQFCVRAVSKNNIKSGYSKKLAVETK